MSTNLNKELDSAPVTTKVNNNMLKDYIVGSGKMPNTTCKEIILGSNLATVTNNIEKVGDFNFRKSSAPNYTQPKTEYIPQYEKPCPEGWEAMGADCYSPKTYQGPCKSGNIGDCPEGFSRSASNCGVCNFSGDLNTCNLACQQKRCMEKNGSFSDRKCYLRRNNVLNFSKMTDQEKADWENKCSAQWPRLRKDTAGFWNCEYGDTLTQNKNIKKIGTVSNPTQAAKMIIDRKDASATYFGIADKQLYISSEGNGDVFQDKNSFLENCSEAGPKVELYKFKDGFLNDVRACYDINTTINDINCSSYNAANTERSPECAKMEGESNIIETFANYDIIENMENNSNLNAVDVFNAIKTERGPVWDQNYKTNTLNRANIDIQTNLNQMMRNLSKNYNTSASLYNKQSSIINRHQDLVESNTKKLNKQLDDLNAISNEIALKTRMIELNEELADKKVRQKKMIIGFFVLLPILILPILLITSGNLSPFVGIGVILLFIVGYLVYILVVYLRGKKKSFKAAKVEKKEPKKESTYISKLRAYYEKENNIIKKQLQQQVYGDCDCPAEEEREIKIEDEFDSEEMKARLSSYKGKVPSAMTLADFQELWRTIGCRKDLNDKDIKYWKGLGTIDKVMEDMKTYYRLASTCTGNKDQNEFCLPDKCTKKNYLLDANGPFMYYDGSAPPQQIYPEPVGKVKVSGNGNAFTLPDEIQKILENIENPVKKLFFAFWFMHMMKRGISFDDPRLKNQLEVIEFEDSNATPSPFWAEIKLPLVSEMDTTVKKVCQKYNSDRRDLGQGVGKFLVDTWNYFFNEPIPNTIYDRWLRRLNEAIENQDELEEHYEQFIKEIMTDNRFLEKYGNMDRFMDVKMKEMMKDFNDNYGFSQAQVTRI